MPQISPAPGDVHVNRPLTNIAVAYMQDAKAFVADNVFPNVPVSKQSDAYFTYDREDWNRDEMKDRAPATESAGGSYKIGNEAYYARVKGFHKDIPDQVVDNTDNPINHDRDTTNFVTFKALLHREMTWATSYFALSIWQFNVAGNATATGAGTFDPEHASNNKLLFWSDATSTPIEDVRAACTTVQKRTGYRPNKLVMGRPVYDKLLDHPDIIARLDRGQTTGPARANRESLAALFELDEIVVMEAIYNAAKDGGAENNDFIGGKSALLVYAAPNPGLLVPSAGYTFSWTGRVGNSNQGLRIKKFRLEKIEATRVESQQAYDQKVIGKDLGYFFSAIIE